MEIHSTDSIGLEGMADRIQESSVDTTGTEETHHHKDEITDHLLIEGKTKDDNDRGPKSIHGIIDDHKQYICIKFKLFYVNLNN